MRREQAVEHPDTPPDSSSQNVRLVEGAPTEELPKRRKQGDHHRRGIYLLPNLFTTASLFSGFYAIVAAMNGDFENAAVAIFICMLMDGLDGRVARLTNTQSDFGAEYDSLTDMVAFGVAPALVAFEWCLSNDLGKAGWAAAFIYVAGAALRLARFNTQLGISDKRYFTGLPSPSAAAVVAGIVWVFHDVVPQGFAAVMFLLLVGSLGALMVSNVSYYSFKELDLRGRVPFVAVLAIVMGFAVVALSPAEVLLGLILLYTLSGPATALLRRFGLIAAKS